MGRQNTYGRSVIRVVAGTYYDTVQILSPRLEIKTARRDHLRRAVFRLLPTLCGSFEIPPV